MFLVLLLNCQVSFTMWHMLQLAVCTVRIFTALNGYSAHMHSLDLAVLGTVSHTVAELR